MNYEQLADQYVEMHEKIHMMLQVASPHEVFVALCKYSDAKTARELLKLYSELEEKINS